MSLDVNSQQEAYRVGAMIRLALAMGLINDTMVAAAGKKQAETLTVLGSVGGSGAGNITVTVTAANAAALLAGKAVTVAVANNDTATQVAGKIRTALDLDADVAAFFAAMGGTGANVIATTETSAANDSTMNLAINPGATGLTAVASSANTTAGANALVDLPVAVAALALPQGTTEGNRQQLLRALDMGEDLGLFTAANLEPLTTADGLIALTGVPDSYAGRPYFD